MIDARQFLDRIAEIIRAAGREVTIEETADDFGTFAWLSTRNTERHHALIYVGARYSNRTKRWALTQMEIWPSTLGKQVVKSRRAMWDAATIWA
jgi:hypothetical protein